MKFRVIAVVFILALPVFFYLFVTSGHHRFRYLQYFGPKQPFQKTENGKQVSDTIYHTVSDISVKNLKGETVSFQKYNPTYWVISFFNTQCKETCTKVFSNLQGEIQKDYKGVDKVKIISITTNPVADSVSVLKRFEIQNGILFNRWMLCLADSLMVDSLMQQSFFMKTGTDLSLENVFLVDPDKHIRGIYDGTDVMEIRRLKDEIKVLSYEYKQKQEGKK